MVLNYELNYQCDTIKCIGCGKETEIPVIRNTKICDDCIEIRIANQQKVEQIKKYKDYLIASKIPKRYWDFDLSRLEIDHSTFENLILTPHSILISGEIGTGKTNLACQLLIQSRGRFFTINDICTADAATFSKMKYGLVVIDDLSKLNTNRYSDKIFDFLNSRYNDSLKTIITTDKRLEELEIILGMEYGRAIVSRIREWCVNKIQLRKHWR